MAGKNFTTWLLATVLAGAPQIHAVALAEEEPTEPPDPPGPPPALPICPITYYGETNGAHYYETASNTCTAPFGLGQTAEPVVDLGCGASGTCIEPIGLLLSAVGQKANAKSKQASLLQFQLPTNYDEALLFLKSIRPKLAKLGASGEVLNWTLDTVNGKNFKRKRTVRDFRDYTKSYLAWMEDADSDAEKDKRFEAFEDHYIPSLFKHVSYWIYVRSGGGNMRDHARDFKSQAAPVNADDVEFTPATGADVTVQEGPIIQVTPKGMDTSIYFKTMHFGFTSNGTQRWKSIGVQINDPGDVSMNNGKLLDRYSFVHRLKDKKTGANYIVTSADDLEFGVISLLAP